MTRTTASLALVIALVLALAAPAGAGPAPADPRAVAKAHFLRGQEHQQAGRYDEAISEYHAAYAAAPMPGFLFNLGQAYRLKGDKRHAVEYYRKYLAAEPNSGPSVEAQEHVQTLSADVVAEEEAARAGAERATADRAAARAAAARAAARTAARPGDDDDDKGDGDATPDPEVTVRRSHRRARDGRFAVRARADIDGKGRGAIAATGLAVRVATDVDVELGAFLGAQVGGYLSVTRAFGRGAWRPIASAGVPLLWLGGSASVGAQGAAGVRWQPTRRVALFATAGALWLANAPSGYAALVWGPSLGAQLTF